MDVLHPNLVNIDGCIYCKYDSKPTMTASSMHVEPDVCWDDEPCDSSNILQLENGRFQASLSVPSALFKYIIGSKGTTRRRLEQETGSSIQIPPKGCEGDIIITAAQRSAAESALSRVELQVAEKRWREPFTHFLTIPLTSSAMKEKFKSFKDKVLKSKFPDAGISSIIFQNQDKLHLTICTLVLLSPNEIEDARTALSKCVVDLSETLKFPLSIQVRGLEYMNDDPSAVDVLYAKVKSADGSDALQTLADRVAQRLVETRLSQKQYDRVKLHATLINTLLGKGRGKNPQNGQESVRETFDARQLLTQFEDFDFGSFAVDEIQLSERFTTAEDGYFRPSARVFLAR